MAARVLFLVGPTASGKSEIALKLAPKVNAEIISCDSMQVYRGMNIGTAKPTKEDRSRIRHHLIDLVTPRSLFSVYQYQKVALAVMDQILEKKRTPLFVGGTGLYMKAVLDGLTQQPSREGDFRKRMTNYVKRHGCKRLYNKLKRLNPDRAKQLHPNDQKRVIRALELIKFSKRNMKGSLAANSIIQPLGARRDVSVGIYGVLRERSELYGLVERRVDKMLAEGWLKEVRSLKRSGFSQTSREAIGYKELRSFLNGEVDFETAVAIMKKRTRHLVKKQMTWFRHDARICWIAVHGSHFVDSAVLEILKHEADKVV